MGNHGSVRAGSGWRRAAIVGVGLGFAYATVGVVGLASGTTSPTPSVYSAVTPVTVLGRSLAAHSDTDVTVAGVDPVPSNATSVQLSVTALSGTTTSSMYVYPTGATKPTSANVRWTTGETVTIPVTVAVGTGGKVRLTTDGGTVTVKVAVVGYFSPAPAPGSTGYAFSALNVSITETAKTIGTIDVPAGTYEVQAKATVEITSGGSDHAVCFVTDPAARMVDTSYMALTSAGDQVPTALMGLDTTAGGTMTLSCYDDGANSDAHDIQFAAIQLSSATGAVTGG
jgi:hypothetical protein